MNCIEPEETLGAESNYVYDAFKNEVEKKLHDNHMTLADVLSDNPKDLLHPSELFRSKLRYGLCREIKTTGESFESILSMEPHEAAEYWHKLLCRVEDDNYKQDFVDISYEDSLYLWHCDNKG
jgi:hypothetical protein